MKILTAFCLLATLLSSAAFAEVMTISGHLEKVDGEFQVSQRKCVPAIIVYHLDLTSVGCSGSFVLEQRLDALVDTNVTLSGELTSEGDMNDSRIIDDTFSVYGITQP